MMIAHPHPPLMTPQDYLDWESAQPLKYEYLNGQVYAMPGGTLPHNSISLNVAAALKNHLRGQGCKVFMADAKVGVSEKGAILLSRCHGHMRYSYWSGVAPSP